MAPRRVVPLSMFVAVLLAVTACGGGAPAAAPTSAPPASSPAAASPSPTASPVPPLAAVRLSVPDALARGPYDEPRELNVPRGWTAAVYARIEKARFMAPLPDGGLLVSQPSGGKVLLVRDGRVTDYLTDLNRPHDIVPAEVGGRAWVFVAEADRVVRYPLTAGAARPGAGQVAVDGLPDESLPELGGRYGHVLKNIAVRGDTLYVSIASTCNVCVSDTESDPIRGAIYRYRASGHNAGRALVARGIRNAEGLAFVPGTDELWAVVNNRDNILVPDDRDVDGDGKGDRGKHVDAYVDDHPPEPFIRVRQDGNYGWPFCNPSPDKGMRNMPYDRDFQYNRDGRALDCATATPVEVGIQAHSAPLGLTFTQGTAAPDVGAVVALHGSWNRTRPTGYKVIHFPWTAGGPGEQADLVTGFQEGTSDPWGRPVDVAVEASGSLLVSDDLGGAVIRLTPP
jgi:glucose/arabinose dehydrogenase